MASLHGGGGCGAGVLEAAAGPPAWPAGAGRAPGAPVRPPRQEPGPPAQEVRGAAGLRARPAPTPRPPAPSALQRAPRDPTPVLTFLPRRQPLPGRGRPMPDGRPGLPAPPAASGLAAHTRPEGPCVHSGRGRSARAGSGLRM